MTPLVLSYYRLARAFGWTPREIQDMTMAQISIYLNMLESEGHGL